MHPMEIHEGVDMSQLTVAEQAALKNGAFAMFSFYAFNSNLCTQNFCPLKLPSWYLPYPLQKGTCLMIFLFPKSVGYERSFPKNQIFKWAFGPNRKCWKDLKVDLPTLAAEKFSPPRFEWRIGGHQCIVQFQQCRRAQNVGVWSWFSSDSGGSSGYGSKSLGIGTYATYQGWGWLGKFWAETCGEIWGKSSMVLRGKTCASILHIDRFSPGFLWRFVSNCWGMNFYPVINLKKDLVLNLKPCIPCHKVGPRHQL